MPNNTAPIKSQINTWVSPIELKPRTFPASNSFGVQLETSISISLFDFLLLDFL